MTAKERAVNAANRFRAVYAMDLPSYEYLPVVIEREIQAAIDEAIAEERKPKSIEQLNEQQGTKPWTGESLGCLSDKETDELLAAIHEGSEEARIQRAVDEALEQAARLVCPPNAFHPLLLEAAQKIRQLKLQPQLLPPTVKHGVDCPKAEHKAGGVMYFHPASHDDSYTMAPAQWDEIRYCGRCHQAL